MRHTGEVNARTLTTKRAVARQLASHGSGPVLVAAVVAGLGLRRRGPKLGLSDLVAVVVVVGLQPLVEWGLHRFLLHGPIVSLGRRSIDAGYAHRGHHQVPDDVAGALLGTELALSNAALVAGIAGTIGALVGGPTVVGTAVAAGEAGLLAYEWTHLLEHSGYRPRTAWFRRLKASHLRHHFRDDGANFGITSRLGDRVFRTAV